MELYNGMEYIYTVYKERSFTKAAKKLFISQPSLSASVKHIEEKVGYPIFDRGTKPISLTECGRKYIESVEKIMAVEDEFTDYLEDLENLRIGKIVLGGSSLYTSWILPPIMADFNRRYPYIQLNLVEEKSSHLFTMLQNDEVDIILDNHHLSSEEFESSFYRKEYVLLAVPRNYSVNEELKEYQLPLESIEQGIYLNETIKPVPIQAFAEYPFILMKPKNHTRAIAEKVFQAGQIHPRVAFELDQQMTSYNITCLGLGISFISDTLVNCVQPSTHVIYYKLNLAYSSRSLCFCWKAGRYLTRAMKEFLKTAHLNND